MSWTAGTGAVRAAFDALMKVTITHPDTRRKSLLVVQVTRDDTISKAVVLQGGESVQLDLVVEQVIRFRELEPAPVNAG